MAGSIPLSQLSSELTRNRRPGTLMPILRMACVADVRGNFDQSRDPDGKPWKPLAISRARGGHKPLQDTGLLAASITARETATELVLGTARPGANLHQHGGVIKPKRGKFLTIPRTPEAARAGGARNFPRPLAFIFGAKGGVAIERKQKGRGQKKTTEEIVHYWLVRKVTVPARPFLGFGKRLLDKLARLIGDWFAQQRGMGQ